MGLRGDDARTLSTCLIVLVGPGRLIRGRGVARMNPVLRVRFPSALTLDPECL